jgi:hypothetical protein
MSLAAPDDFWKDITVSEKCEQLSPLNSKGKERILTFFDFFFFGDLSVRL